MPARCKSCSTSSPWLSCLPRPRRFQPKEGGNTQQARAIWPMPFCSLYMKGGYGANARITELPPTRRPARHAVLGSPLRGTLLLPSMEKIALLPPLLFVYACVLFVTSYHATFSSGVLAPLGDSLTPPISLLMFAGTGRRIGQVGFPTLCVGFYVCMRRLRSALLAAGIKGVLLFGSANTAFAALAVVGLVPLHGMN